MEFYKREYFISMITTGKCRIKVNNRHIYVYSPSVDIIYKANEFVFDGMNNSELYTDDELYNILLERNLWTEDEEKQLTKILPDNIDRLKVGLFESVLHSNKVNTIRKYLKTTNDKLSKLHNKRHIYDYMSISGYMNYLRYQYYIKNCSTTTNGDPVDWSTVDINNTLSAYYSAAILSSSIIRFLAKTTPWNNQWPALKMNGKIFDSTYLDPNQQRLIAWSVFYDNVAESIECPSDDVIEDDDMLDGWAILQRRKRDVERDKRHVESSISNNSKINNADDIFVVVDTFEDAQKIDTLNAPRQLSIKKNRMNQITKDGIVKEQQLHDVKQDIHMQQNQSYADNVRR